ncbi:protein inturned-like [Uloborus diversus]|uniref:protein inturned-like n=1 Tax=Uloborus diversus TaxID=327109 RepID=UPI00240A541E|nr:protein inturned-like [Uloborus diversus]
MAEKPESYASEDDSCSCGSSDCEQGALWLDHVGSRGDLFYIEADIDSIKDDMKSTYIDGTHFETTQPKLNAADKFRKWLKNRQKYIPKISLSKSKPEKECSDGFLCGSSPPMASKDIFVDIKFLKETFAGKIVTATEVLGLYLGNIPGDMNYLKNKMQIVGFAPGKECSGLKIGDYLKSIDDVDVDFENIDKILNQISSLSRVKLTILSPLPQTSSKSQQKFGLIKELLGDPEALEEAKSQFRHVPHGLFYFLIESEENENDGVIYRYPDEDSLLLQLKGMFITLALMIKDVASPPVLSCSVKLDEEIVHVGFLKEDNEIMLLVFPASCVTTAEVQYFTTSLAKLLKFQFQALKVAFTTGNDEKRMDQFCILYFRHILSYSQERKRALKPHFMEAIPSVQWIPLPSEISAEIEDVLSELESCDYQPSSDGFSYNQRTFSIIGCCLFFKGYLISNHFPKHDLLDVHSFLHHHHIFDLTKMKFVSDVIIWQEVFPSHFDDTSNSTETYTRKHGRSVLLVAGLHHAVLAVLLEDGGCAVEAGEIISPDPFYVEEVQNTLIILQDCALLADVEKMLTENVVSFTPFGPKKDPGVKVAHVYGKKSTKSFHTDKLDEMGSERQLLISSMGPADGESDEESSYSDVSSENEATGELKRRHSISTGSTAGSQGSDEYFSSSGKIVSKLLGRNISSSSQVYNDVSQESLPFAKNLRTLSGCGSTIFHYVHISNNEGIYIAPLDNDPCLFSESSVNGILHAFDVCCLKFRYMFLNSFKNEEICKKHGRTPRGLSYLTHSVYEQGVMFEYAAKRHSKLKSKKFTFWVAARLLLEPDYREVYVCHHESTKREVVEIAFRLGFGVSI